MNRDINYYAGRAAVFLGVAVALATALLPIIADTDWESTVGILGGAAAALVVLREFIGGAQKHEARIARGAALAPGLVNYYAGRVATYVGVFIGLATALAPILANTDWTSTAGILAGAAAATVVIREFIVGAQKHEERLAGPLQAGTVTGSSGAPTAVGQARPDAPR